MLSIKDLEKLGNLLKCSVCNQLANNCSIAPCSHLFCKYCISQYINSKPECPKCNRPTSKRGLTEIGNLDRIVEEFKTLKDKVTNIYTPKKLRFNEVVDVQGLKLPMKRRRENNSEMEEGIIEEKLLETRRLIEKRKKGVLLVDALLDDLSKNGVGALDMDYHPVLECVFPFNFVQELTRRKRRKINESWSNEESESKKKKKLVLCSSGLNHLETVQVKKAAKIIGGRYVQNPTQTMTHLIVKADNVTRIQPKVRCKRTKKYCCAILQGSWIVSLSWIVRILEERQRVSETFYEVWGDTQSGDERSPVRLARLHAVSKGEKLFSNLIVYAYKIETRGHLDLIKSLVVYGGGDYLDGLPTPEDTEEEKTVLVVVDEQPLQETLKEAQQTGHHVVHIGFFLDSISDFQLKDLD